MELGAQKLKNILIMGSGTYSNIVVYLYVCMEPLGFCKQLGQGRELGKRITICTFPGEPLVQQSSLLTLMPTSEAELLQDEEFCALASVHPRGLSKSGNKEHSYEARLQ